MSLRERSSGWKTVGSLRAPVSQDRWTVLTISINSAHSRSKSRMETTFRKTEKRRYLLQLLYMVSGLRGRILDWERPYE